MSGRTAIVRPPADSLDRCELTHQERSAIDVGQARREHDAYGALLQDAGYELAALSADPAFPDGVFVEDTAVVLDELAVLARPGARSRRGEVEDVAEALAPLRPVARIEAPATLDGGDVLRVGRTLFVGVGTRTTELGVGALRDLVGAHGYRVVAVAVGAALHLKTAATALDDETVILNPAWVEPSAFAGLRTLDIDPREPSAANVLRLGDRLVMNAACPRTIERVRHLGHRVTPHDLTELAKAEAGLTCSSLLIEA